MTSSMMTEVPVVPAGECRTLAELEALYRSHESAVFTLARRLLGNDADAEDVLQETFLIADKNRSAYRGQGSEEGWLKRICLTQALMRLRRLRLESTLEGAEHLVAIEGAERRDLAWALDQLPPVSRSVVWLHDVEGYTHEEIGQLFQLSASFSRSQLSRAHARLRSLLEAQS